MHKLKPNSTLAEPDAPQPTGQAMLQKTAFTEPQAKSSSLLRRWTGALTDELRLGPGDYGLGHLPARLKPDAIVETICGFCSTGCGLDVHLRDGTAVNLTPALDYPVNSGLACPKGWEALACLNAPDRATTPLLRSPATGQMQTVDWDEALQVFVLKFKALIDQHGPESVAFLSTGQMCTEEMALLGAVWKFGMGAWHGDSNTRQCMATAHVAYKQSFGFDAPPFAYEDLEASDTLVFIGANPCIAHPILWQRVMRNRNHPKIIVVDPRRTETAMNATQHLALKPKSDLTLLYGMANLLIESGWINREFIERFTAGFDAFARFVRQFPLPKVATETGLTIGELFRFAEAIHLGQAVSFWWTMGVNQGHESTRTAQAIINLALMTGNIGKPGTGANSLTGQCNAMGSRLFANVTSLFGRDFLKPDHREQVARQLGIPTTRIPARASYAYDQIVESIAQGKIKGLWVIATNPCHSWIGQGRLETDPGLGETAPPTPTSPRHPPLTSVLAHLEFLVVQDMFTTTETARRAHLILPAAGWGEKEGTFINSERRIGLVKKISKAPGQALSDFKIFQLVAHYWGCGELFAEWSSPQAAFQILKRLSAGQPCDFTGIRDYRHIEDCGGIQWPWTEAMQADSGDKLSPGRRLFTNGRFFHPDGKAQFHFDLPRPVAEPPDSCFPFILLTGRGTSAQWHTNTRTAKSALLRLLYPANPYVEVNPADALRLGVRSNDMVTVVSRRGRVGCTAFVTSSVQPGQLFIPMHYEIANKLTRAEFDPESRQPNYKHCAVRLEPREK